MASSPVAACFTAAMLAGLGSPAGGGIGGTGSEPSLGSDEAVAVAALGPALFGSNVSAGAPARVPTVWLVSSGPNRDAINVCVRGPNRLNGITDATCAWTARGADMALGY